MSDYWRLASLYLVYFALVGGMAPYWSLYLQHLGFNPRQLGILLAAPMLTKILLPNLWGWLADVTGKPRLIMQLGTLGALCGFTGVFWREDFAGLLLCIVTFSAFWNAVLPQVDTITLRCLGADTHLYSRVRLWGSVGFTLAVFSLGGLFDYLSVAYLPHILLVLLLGLGAVGFTLPQLPPKARDAARLGIWHLVRQPKVYSYLLATLAFQMSHGIYYGFYSIYLQLHGYSHSQIGAYWTLGVLAEILMFWLLPRFFSRLSIELAALACIALGALRWSCIGLLVDSPWALGFLQLFHACTFGLFHACGVEFIRRHFGAAQQGQGQALYAALGYGLGGASGVFVCGWLWDFTPAWSFAFAVIAALAGVVWAWRAWRSEALY